VGDDGADKKAIGGLLRQARQMAGLTQEALAAKTGLSVRAIGDLERGLTARPHQRSLELLAEALGLPAPTRALLIGTSHQEPVTGATDIPFAGHPAGGSSGEATELGNGAAPRQLPTDIPDFTGRAGQLVQLRGRLSGRPQEATTAVPLVLVVGSAGVGKTTLVVHAAHLLASHFPDGQLYVNLLGATQPLDPAEVLARFLRELGTAAERIPASAEERAAQYRTVLADRQVLIVLDNARDAAQVQPLMPGTASCAVVVTARGHMPDLVGASVVDLDVLPAQEAAALFSRITGEQRAAAEPAATGEVLAACAGLPLAIRIAAARLATRGGWTVRALADRLANERRRLDELRAGNLAVRASFEVSYTTLPGPQTPGGADPAEAFRLLGLWTGPSISLPAAAALLGHPQYPTADALDVLVDARLLESPEPDRYRFHDLLRVYAADRALSQETEQTRTTAITRLLTWYLHTTESAAAIIFPHRSNISIGDPPAQVEPLGFRSLELALAWCEIERPSLMAATRLAGASGLHEIAWKLPATAMSFYYRRSYWEDWGTSHELGLSSARAIEDRRAEAWMLTNLGMAYGAQRRTGSVGYFERALAICGEVGDANTMARATNNLATAYAELGMFSEAKQAAERALDLERHRGDRYGEGIALDILGFACRELGQPGEAISHLKRALAISRELGARDAEAESLSELGETYASLGQLSQAITCLRSSLTTRQDLGDRHLQAMTLERLGRAHRSAGDLAEAQDLLTAALQLWDDLGETSRVASVRGEILSLTSGRDEA
jgi:tetratricopeptide (TPR) repeat protein/transcriptional regulator with XRE-family HTH domain